jgi:short-subunit dehydrogenase
MGQTSHALGARFLVMHPERRRTVLVTGASTGIGLALGKLLLARPYRVILTARRASLPRFATAGIRENEDCWLRPLDVTNQSEREQLIEEAEWRWGGIDVLVNNAGLSYRAVVEHVSEDERLLQMDVNFLSPMELTRLVLPGMRKRRYGRILNVSSVGGMMAMPTMSMYSASKFALEGASEALYYEVKPWGIAVSLIQPGFINSSGFENVRFTNLSQAEHDRADAPYYQHYRKMEGFIAKAMRAVPSTSESVARKVIRTMEARRPALRVPATFDAVLFSGLRRWLPRRLYHWVLYRSLPSIRTWGPSLDAAPAEKRSQELVATAVNDAKRRSR